MKNVTSLLILSGALALTTAGAGLVACSSSSTPSTTPKTTPDSGSTTPTPDSGNTPTPDSGGGGEDAAANCTPLELHVPTPDGGIYCPFSYNDATDAGTQYCTNGTEMCCVSPASDAGSSVCVPFGESCPSPVTTFSIWQCASPADCVGAPVDGGGEPLVCCLGAGKTPAETTDAGCTYNKSDGNDGMSCMAASACTGSFDAGKYSDYYYVVCEQDSDCTAAGAGSTCNAIKTIGTVIGVCSLNL